MVTATKVIGEHSHLHSALQVGGLTNRGNENGNIIQCPVTKLYQKKCTKVAGNPH